VYETSLCVWHIWNAFCEKNRYKVMNKCIIININISIYRYIHIYLYKYYYSHIFTSWKNAPWQGIDGHQPKNRKYICKYLTMCIDIHIFTYIYIHLWLFINAYYVYSLRDIQKMNICCKEFKSQCIIVRIHRNTKQNNLITTAISVWIKGFHLMDPSLLKEGVSNDTHE
jgi:hypothetical protein